MQPKTNVVLRLIQEIDKCCGDNHINYICGGLFARALLQKKDLIIQQGDIDVDVNDISRLVEILGNKNENNRAVEYADGINRYPSFSVRYIDTSTTFINNRTISIYEKPGIYVEIIPVVHLDPEDAGKEGGLFYGDRRIKAGSFYEAVDLLKTERNEDTVSYIQDATGEIKIFDYSLFTDTVMRFFNGYEIRTSRDIRRLFEVLYRKEDGNVKYPSFLTINNIITAEVSYKDIFGRIDNLEDLGYSLSGHLSRIDELTNRIDQRNKKIQEVLDEVRRLYNSYE